VCVCEYVCYSDHGQDHSGGIFIEGYVCVCLCLSVCVREVCVRDVGSV
jgi:hypothetical protein